ncbi:MAG: histidine--tRNA ligase [Candidatus Liptonbacteria bacterium RIFCSPHIGHO2_01_FULL_57_28]|uniref:Histidine--tRNA ligase n=1 Tax=Candidatus Liptonbacteria bacterium RIFCSPHIGHO2_01_FULL_57_28 TaxID=1798647 RepID=A0A1G2C9Y4_9BACT|nr:MAG: histidine--tRNA ligase [Candidatus Liptonbacteria bacterium RIFCSPHIGHO2_01_FULL_57_28]
MKTNPADRKLFLAVRGTHDILPSEWPWWDRIYSMARKLADFYHFNRIDTPLFEDSELLAQALGQETDVVQKEMYTVHQRSGETLALRPDGTPGLTRAYLEHRMSRTNSFQKLWYTGPMFRSGRVDEAHWRQFHQIGFDVLGGASDPLYDAQVILIAVRLLEEAKLKNLVVRINCTGCRICRPIYLRQLQNYYKDHLKDLCEDCGRRFKTNTLRLLDCRKEGCLEMREGAPNFFDKLCSPCSVHFSGVLEYLDELAISYALDNFFLSDFDHYNRTVFDISVEGAGSEQSNLASGGRYDYLFEKLGGKATPAVGVALGIERIIAALRAQGAVLPEKAEKRVFIIHVGELAKKKLLGIIETLRAAGIPVGEALSRESLGAQLKLAEREHAAVALMLGQKEIFEESVIIRDLQRRSQETVPLNRMVEEIKKRLK